VANPEDAHMTPYEKAMLKRADVALKGLAAIEGRLKILMFCNFAIVWYLVMRFVGVTQ
jgi:hypothetical protein